MHQGVSLVRFKPAEKDRKIIDFSAYGRQLDRIHKSLLEYCSGANRYYDFNTTIPRLEKGVGGRESYQKYAWHLSHSIFNFCWPLNLTHSSRVRTFSPISPRYFESAASGNVILGRAPADIHFDSLFGPDAVISIDHENGSLGSLWDRLYDNREEYLDKALARRAELSDRWSWESRVREILRIINAN